MDLILVSVVLSVVVGTAILASRSGDDTAALHAAGLRMLQRRRALRAARRRVHQ